ncbi:MAG: GGDEF domain-containing protein [Planctomycetota bacterium]
MSSAPHPTSRSPQDAPPTAPTELITPPGLPPIAPRPTPLRLLVIQDQTLADRLHHAAHPTPNTAPHHALRLDTKVVPGFLAALGELVSQPATAVVGPANAMPNVIASTGQALSRIAPHTRLVALTDPDTPADTVAELHDAGFITLPRNPTAAEFFQAIGHPLPPRTAPTTPPASPAPPASQPVAIPTPPTTSPQAPGATLADTDLIDAALAAHGQLKPLALDLLAQQSQIPGVTLADPNDTPPENHAALSVDYLGEHFGHLHAPTPVPNDTLAAWAAWLARWLALDQRLAQLKDLSMRDELTGVWNRRYFNRFLTRILERARTERQQVTVLVFDIDNFKSYNDKYGHGVGDEVLAETARLMQSVVRDHDVVARIGGDEFAVIFWDHGETRRVGSQHPQDVLNIARRFQHAVCTHQFPKLLEEAHGSLTISGGLAAFPWDGQTPDVLLDKADQMAMSSKRQGKNAITFGQAALQAANGNGSDTPPASG